MFVHMKKIPAKTADALDLIIEFATLGEYGLEYPAEDPRIRAPRCDEGRRRGHPRTVRTATACPAGNPDFASALRPPRIKLDV